MVREPDHLLWKCLCCDDCMEIFRPSVSLPYTHTHIHTHTSLGANMVKRREKKKKKPSSPFLLPPISALYSASVPNPQHIDLSSLSSDFILRTKQLGRGGASPAGPDLSCKKRGGRKKKGRWHIVWREQAKRERRAGKHKQRGFNMMVASGTEATAEEGAREEIAYNTKAFEW